MTGKDLKIARAHLEMSQADLASELGIAGNTISRYEVGTLQIPRTIELAVEGLLCRQREREQGVENKT